tara:strand:+ start:139 stop:738 length:600 start_codon:yes stop_codon:yes gene_type:complete
MNKYIFSLAFVVIINVSSEELKYECECVYAEISTKDPMENTENTQEDPNCKELNEGNPENTVFIINLDDEYIYDAENTSLRSKLEKIDDSQYLANITNDQFKEMIKTWTGDEPDPEEMSDFAKGMIDMLGGMFEFATLKQKSSFEILIDGRIQKDDEVFIEMNFAEMFKGLDMPLDNDFASLGIFKTNISTYSMCEQID